MPLARLAGRGAFRMARRSARRRMRGWRRAATRPWRTGEEGAAAEVGRWIGAGLAVGSVLAGLGAALYAEWPRD